MAIKALQNPKHNIKDTGAWVGIGVMILGPLWGYVAIGFRHLLHGGLIADTLSFYLMIAGWMIMPVGILLLLYRLAVRAILKQRRDP